jgi:large subunit ribosomal protein L31e
MEKTFNVPLRKEFMKVPRYKRAKKASKALYEFLVRHMKSADVRIGKELNKAVWARGIKNPPHHVPVHAEKDEKGVVRAELVGVQIEKEKPEEKKGLREKLGMKAKKPADNAAEKEVPKEATAPEAIPEAPAEEKTAEPKPKKPRKAAKPKAEQA